MPSLARVGAELVGRVRSVVDVVSGATVVEYGASGGNDLHLETWLDFLAFAHHLPVGDQHPVGRIRGVGDARDLDRWRRCRCCGGRRSLAEKEYVVFARAYGATDTRKERESGL